jgi:peroxiredoxin
MATWPTVRRHVPAPRRRVVPMALGVAAVLAIAGLAGWLHGGPRTAGAASVGRLRVGEPAPVFVVPGLDGGTLALTQYAGRPRVVTFFATSCGECLGDLAVLEPAYLQYRSRGLVVLGIGVEDVASNLKQAVRQFGVSFPVGYDEDGSRVAVPYGLHSVPTTVFIDGRGIVRDVARGSVRGAALGRALKLILPPATP